MLLVGLAIVFIALAVDFIALPKKVRFAIKSMLVVFRLCELRITTIRCFVFVFFKSLVFKVSFF